MHILPLNAVDFYKTGHHEQYPDGTTQVYSNFTPRDDKHIISSFGNEFDHKVVFFGLQGVCQWLLIDLWNREFFNKDKNTVVYNYARRLRTSLGKEVDVSHIEALHDLGYLPIVIKALPEGSRVNIRVPYFTIRATLPEFYWLTNYLETQLSAEMWKPITSATTAYQYRKIFEKYAKETGTSFEFVNWQGHDFSMRGMSGIYDATSSGAAHLTVFKGTDTVTAIDYHEDYYGANAYQEIIGGSVPATEHSVMCMGGNFEGEEVATFKRLITETYPDGIVSIVSDTWDLWEVVTKYTVELRDEILARNGKVVFRPDSGDPVKIICGSALKVDSIDSIDWSHLTDAYGYEYIRIGNFAPTYYKVSGDELSGYHTEKVEPTSEMKGVIECLWDVFGGTVTDEGYKLLNDHVGAIYGDSINLDRARRILEGLKAKGFASGNIVFGIGSFTYQYVTRDNFGQAMKSTYGEVNGVGRNIFKDPKTDNGVKKSAKGLLRVEKEGDNFVLYDCQTWEQEASGELKEVFRDSKLMRFQTLAEIRELLHG